MNLRRYAALALLSVFLALPILGGCGAIVSQLAPVIAAVQDATAILDTIDRFADGFFAQKPDKDLEVKYAAAMARARTSLHAVTRATKGTEALDKGDVSKALTEFKQAYSDLMAIAEPMGVHRAPLGTPLDALGAKPGELAVPEPLAFGQ